MAVDRRLRFAALILIPILMAVSLPRRISSRRSVMDKYEWLEDGARLHILANVVRPLHATCKQYPFFDFPFCPPGEPITNRTRSLQDLLAGDCFTNTQYEVRFMTNTDRKILCEKTLTKEEVAKFKDAIRRKFAFQLAHSKGFVWGKVGRIEEDENGPQYYLVTHLNFYVKYYKNRVIKVMLMRDNETDVEITEDAETKVDFTYSVFWERATPNDLTLSEEDEMVYDDDNGSWTPSLLILSTYAALICVFMLLTVTLPYLMSYSSRYRCPKREEECSDMHIHGDSCDNPQYTSLLGAILGNGIQLLMMVCHFFVLAYKGYLHPCNIQSLCSQIFQAYCFTSVIAGYKATSFHAGFSQAGWKECIFQAATIYFVPVLVTILVTNCLAVVKYGISNASELVFFSANIPPWELTSVVFLTLGGVLAHYLGSESRPPCATTKVQREIPDQSWYMKTPIQMLLGTLIPSAVIYHEMDKIYASLWSLKLCGAFQTLLLSFAMLIMLTVVTAICCTMAKYDHKWWWRSVLRGGSPAIFMFGYGIYFFTRTRINEGLMIRIVGYNACISYALFLILGTISFYASSFVVRVKHNLQKKE